MLNLHITCLKHSAFFAWEKIKRKKRALLTTFSKSVYIPLLQYGSVNL